MPKGFVILAMIPKSLVEKKGRYMLKNPRILLLDIESCGVNALKADLGFVIVFGWKWLGEKSAHALTISKQDLQKFSDRNLLIRASKLIQEADFTVGHYSSIFDKKFIQGRLMINNLPAFYFPRMRDTCLGLRAVTNFSSKRLKHAAKIMKFRHQKMENNWPSAWMQIMRGDMRALRGLAEYCKGDVLALEELYLRLRPYIKAWKEKE